uniref:Uncharacterized protein n=1 Tax=Phenylobacterium glaciei TaxID=2803784 RepID=A0A974P800_9CAUL|nr:hypothetical protein JKL49_02805 [Phenylobacterium glaciei]
MLVLSAAFAAVATPALLAVWPAPAEAAQALRASAHAAQGEIPPTPAIEEMIKSFIPTNPVKVAADGAMAPWWSSPWCSAWPPPGSAPKSAPPSSGSSTR